MCGSEDVIVTGDDVPVGMRAEAAVLQGAAEEPTKDLSPAALAQKLSMPLKPGERRRA
jgi:hypothetical protein